MNDNKVGKSLAAVTSNLVVIKCQVNPEPRVRSKAPSTQFLSLRSAVQM